MPANDHIKGDHGSVSGSAPRTGSPEMLKQRRISDLKIFRLLSLLFSARSLLLWSACLAILVSSGCAPFLYQSRPVAVDLSCPEPLGKGLNSLFCQDGQQVLLYLPEYPLENPAEVGVLAIIHGYQRNNSREQSINSVTNKMKTWFEFARDNNFILVGPLFDRDLFNNDYQRLNLRGVRADTRLNMIVDEIGKLVPAVNTDKISLFGFSGGGQFVHRYVAFNPEKVQAAVAAGAGWYMWPDTDLPYPIGFRLPYSFRYERPCIEALFEMSLLVLVGEEDTTYRDFRQLYRGFDLNELQGRNRLERATNWFQTMKQQAGENSFIISFDTVPGTGHEVSKQMLHMARQFILQSTAVVECSQNNWALNLN